MMNPISHEEEDKPIISRQYQQNEKFARSYAELFGFLADVFNQKPDKEMVENLKSAGTGFWEDLEVHNSSNPNVRRGITYLSNFYDQVQSLEVDEIEKKMGMDWTKLFRGLGAGYGPMPPYESLFMSKDASNIEIIRRVSQAYIHHNLVGSDEQKNRQDYLGVELDFMRYLAEKEANAWAGGDESKAGYYANELMDFFSEHPKQWAAAFCDQAARQAETKFYSGFLYLLKGILEDLKDEKSVA
jgi:putative dimethyl sulfoxide reductase chaperone